MSLRTRLFINHPLTIGTSISLNREQSHYLYNVLRMKIGESLRIFNGQDGEWEASVSSLHNKQVVIVIHSQLITQTAEKELHLAFCLLKNTSPSFIVQKATELGVTHIWPLISKRTTVKKTNMEKLEKSAIEASEQSERLIIPHVHNIQSLPNFITTKPFPGFMILCNENMPSSDLLLLRKKITIPNGNCILVGPEGGWSEEELDHMLNIAFTIPVNFGKRIMRAETAILASLSAYNTVMDNWN